MKSDMVSIYMKQIEKIPLLTAAEERNLLEKASKGDKKAREKVINANLRFVVKMANQFKNRGVDFEDLICEGNTALLRAIEKIDVTKDVKFITYASFWIRQYMKAAVYTVGRCVSIPQNRPDQLKNKNFVSTSLDKPFDSMDIDSPCMVDVLSDNKNRTPEEQVLIDSSLDQFDYALDSLKSTEKFVLESHFGLNGHEQQGLREIGQIIGVSRETVRQIECKALLKLQNNQTLYDSFIAA